MQPRLPLIATLDALPSFVPPLLDPLRPLPLPPLSPPPSPRPPAVKCNPEPALLATLDALGCGFDCASQAELSTVISHMGVPPSRVIFANPCKRPADIALARRLGVERTTFDTECELLKIQATYPSAGCVLRLRCDDPDAQVGCVAVRG